MDRTACTEPLCLYNGALYLYLYLYSHYRPYSLYRASVLVPRCTLILPIPQIPLWAVRLCTEPQCLYNGALYLYLYLYSPYGPYGLYRTSVPVQRCTLPLPIPLLPYWPYGLYRASVPVQCCTLSLPIPLLPLWTVQPVQSLSACTTVHFTFTYTSTPLWAVRSVQSLSACTTVHFIFTYTSTPPMDCTACTEPQCLYKSSL